MALLCSLSSEPCVEPVATKNGDVYERRLIEKHIATTGIDPVTKEPLTVEDLIPLKVVPSPASIRPKTATQQGIPAMLQGFQAEWDSLMLEVFTLKQQLTASQQELSHALYQQDAACRVIARLVKERDQYKREMSALRSSGASAAAPSGNGMDVDGNGPIDENVLSEEIMQRIVAKMNELSAAREHRKISPSTANRDQVASYQVQSTQNNHKATPAAVKCLDVAGTKDLIISGGADKSVVVFDKSSGKKVSTTPLHAKAVVAVKYVAASDSYLTAGEDGFVRQVSMADGKTIAEHQVTTEEITCMDVHPIGDLVVVGYANGFSMVELSGAQHHTVLKTKPSPITAIQFHPDGEIFAIGTANGLVRIHKVSTLKEMAVFEGHTGAIASLSFSENGYSLASASADQTLRVWDLQEIGTSKTVQLDSVPSSLSYDFSGRFLAVGCGKEIRVFTGRNVDLVAAFDAHTKDVTGIRWGPDAKWFASVSADRSLKIWAPQ